MYHRNFRGFLLELFEEESAHISIENALKNIQFDNIGVQPHHLPYSIWQLMEHIKITQWDIVEFSTNQNHISPNWPSEFWPSNPAPKDKAQWENTLYEIQKDRQRMIEIIKDPSIDLLKPFPYDTGKNLFREALILLDHTSYHLGEVVVLRRLLNDWNN